MVGPVHFHRQISEAPLATQETFGKFQEFLASAKPELRPICEALRQLVGSLHQDAVELVWPKQRIASFGVGPKKMSEHYAYIAIHGAHVNLGFYHGASLADPKGRLEGTGKGLRHIKLRDLDAAQSAALKNMLRQAIRERQNHLDNA